MAWGASHWDHLIETGWRGPLCIRPDPCVLRKRMAVVISTCLSTFQTPGGPHTPVCPPTPVTAVYQAAGGVVIWPTELAPSGTRQTCPWASFPLRYFLVRKLCHRLRDSCCLHRASKSIAYRSPHMRHSDPRSSGRWTMPFACLPCLVCTPAALLPTFMYMWPRDSQHPPDSEVHPPLAWAPHFMPCGGPKLSPVWVNSRFGSW